MKHPLVPCLASLIALAATPFAQTPLKTELVASGFQKPVQVLAPPDDRGRLFVVEQTGLIHVVRDGAALPTPFADLSGTVAQDPGDVGLLSIAFDPAYATNGFVYVSYNDDTDEHRSVVARYEVSASDPDALDPASATILFGPLDQPTNSHNGGHVAFGPDGMLYVGLGDGGSAHPPVYTCPAQDGALFYGKLLRLMPDGSVPADNPFVGDPAVLDEIWALGLRNPWRFSFDRVTGDLYVGDVGHLQIEEIDFLPAGSPGGANFGWEPMEGSGCETYGLGCDPAVPTCGDPALTPPVHEYAHTEGCAVIGGFVYRGCAIPDLRGAYFFADYCTNRVWSFRYDGTTLTDLQERTAELAPGGGLSIATISSFGEDADGELYLVDRLGGEVFKVVPDVPPPFVDLGFAKAGASGVAPELDLCGLIGSGETATIRLRNAPPSAPVAALISFNAKRVQLWGGTIVPDVATGYFEPAVTDATGSLEATLDGVAGPVQSYVQFGVLDPGATFGVAFSNAIRLDYP